jgi:hypothetical protein
MPGLNFKDVMLNSDSINGRAKNRCIDVGSSVIRRYELYYGRQLTERLTGRTQDLDRLVVFLEECTGQVNGAIFLERKDIT